MNQSFTCSRCGFSFSLSEPALASISRNMDIMACPVCGGEVQMTRTPSAQAPTVEEFDPYIARICSELLAVLRERGKQYGEQVLFDAGESGILEQVRTKLGRISGSLREGHTFDERFDSWLDLAGYSVLVCAMADWDGKINPMRYRRTDGWQRSGIDPDDGENNV